MGYKEHALLEFKACGWIDEKGKYTDEMQKLMCKQVLELLDLFSSHGHSGFSAPSAINMFKLLASFEPLKPLTGEEWEWTEVSEGVFQNKRCSHVFKDKDRFNGNAYDIEGKIFREPNGACFANKDSCVEITFPYTPTSIFVDVKK